MTESLLGISWGSGSASCVRELLQHIFLLVLLWRLWHCLRSCIWGSQPSSLSNICSIHLCMCQEAPVLCINGTMLFVSQSHPWSLRPDRTRYLILCIVLSANQPSCRGAIPYLVCQIQPWCVSNSHLSWDILDVFISFYQLDND